MLIENTYIDSVYRLDQKLVAIFPFLVGPTVVVFTVRLYTKFILQFLRFFNAFPFLHFIFVGIYFGSYSHNFLLTKERLFFLFSLHLTRLPKSKNFTPFFSHSTNKGKNLGFDPQLVTMYFDGFGYHHHNNSFEQTYRCYPGSFIDKPQLESGDKIIMPPSALDRLASLHIEYPMLFEIRNNSSDRISHCGVLEFIAEEGMIYMPYWMMQNLLLQEGDFVRVKNATLPKGTYVKLQPHTTDFLDISNPKAILEKTLRNYSCLTTGDSIMVAYNNKKYYIDIVETKPSNAISIIETDCEVDFAPPLDYKEPEPVSRPLPAVPGLEAEQEEEKKFLPFVGTGRRLDGRPSKNEDSIPVPVSQPKTIAKSGTSQSQPSAGTGQPSAGTKSGAKAGKLVFGQSSRSSKETEKGKEKKEESEKKEEPQFQAFTGKRYSLKG
ncbi:hypothetical protein LUZ60_011766 [Juncus effusus]|nr:hypothetical protein LUZ60_011766 [Juncus effusus]